MGEASGNMAGNSCFPPSGPTSAMRQITLLSLLLALGFGCAFPRDECATNSDCGDGECTRTHECVSAGALQSARIFWTLYGAAPDEAACESVEEMTVSFIDRDTEDNVVFRPVPCTLGQIFFDRMAARFDEVRLSARGRNGRTLDDGRAGLSGSESEISFDLRP